MAIARDELYEGGKALMRERFGNGQSMHMLPVTVLEVNRGGARVRIDKSGREIIKKFADLEPDHDWLDERDKKEDEKRERIRREGIIPESSPVRLVTPMRDPPKPLTQSLGDLLQSVLPPPPTPDPVLAPDPATLAKEQGARLSLIREARDLSRGALARRTGYDESAVGGWERGDCAAPDDVKAKLAAALEVDVEELFDLDLALPDVTPFRRSEAPAADVDASARVWRNGRGGGRPNRYGEAVRAAAIRAYVETDESVDGIAQRLGLLYSSQVGKWAQQDGHPVRRRKNVNAQLSLETTPAPTPPAIEVPAPARLPELEPVNIAEPVLVAAPPPVAPLPILASPPPLKAQPDMVTRRTFTDGFKYEIARSYVRREKSSSDIEKEHAIGNSTLHNWVGMYNRGELTKVKAAAAPAPKSAPKPVVRQPEPEPEPDDDDHEVVELAPQPPANQLARTSQHPPQMGRAVVLNDELQRLRFEVDRLTTENARLKAQARQFLAMLGESL